MGTLMSIPFDFSCESLYDIEEINSSFAVGKLKVMYLGNNRNGSHFSKHAVEKALPSLKNVPIVCHWDSEAEEIGGHDVTVISDSDGSIRLKNLTEPCGVVPDHASFSFQKDTDSEGNEHEYLVIDNVILWKRQDVYKHITDTLGGKVKHSMEINVIDNVITPDNYYDVLDFEFTALCLLGNCEPCFQGSELELFSVQNFKQKMEQMMSEIKETFAMVNTPSGDDIHPQNHSMEGGEKVLEEKNILIEKYSINVEELDFSVDDYSLEELEEKFKAISEAKINSEEIVEEDFALESNFVDELRMALAEEKVQREWGECERYWFVDYDKEASQVYCWDTNDWLLYGFEFEVNGDAVVIKADSKKRKKFEIVDFDNGEQSSPIAQIFESMEKKIIDNAELEAKYQTASDKIVSMETELNELKQFKLDIETAKAKEERDAIFANFKDLEENEAFIALKDNCMNYEVDAIEEKCFAIRGRNTNVKFSVNAEKTPKLKVEKNDLSSEPYGGIFVEYGFDA